MIEKFNAILGIVNFILLVYLIYNKKNSPTCRNLGLL